VAGHKTVAVLLFAAAVTAGCSSSQDSQRPPEEKAPAQAETTTVPPLPWSDLASQASARDLTTELPRAVTRICTDIASRAAEQGTPRPVFCPPLVPDVAAKVELAGGVLRYRHFDDGYNIGFWSPDVAHGGEFGGHWSIAAGEVESLRRFTHPSPPLAPPGASRQEPVIPAFLRTTLRGIPVGVYRVPEARQGGSGFYSGHVVFEWQHGDTTFHVTMHGHDNEAQARLMAAALIELVRACPTEAARRAAPETCRLVFGAGSA